MNPATDPVSAAAAAALAPPPQPPQPHRLSTSCDRHPEERFTGFCPSCLCERLSVLDQSNNDAASSSSRKPPTISAAAFKALFKPSGNSGGGGGNNNGNGRVKPGFFPELRRTKSFSASKNNEGFSGVFEPQRRSCDVRLRSSLWNLFSQDEQRNLPTTVSGGEIEVEPRKSSVAEPVLEVNDEGEAESDDEVEEEEDYVEAGDFEILNDSGELKSDEIVEEIEEIVETEKPEKAISEEELKPIKDYIDLDSHIKKPSVRRSFWSAASLFSKKLQKWRQNQKMKKRRNGGDHRPGSARLPVEKPIGRQLRDTQSEIADYGFGRRSCDTDPRFSLDAGRFSLDAGRFSVDIGRISLDDPRYSFDEPRASWDGSLIGRTAFPPAARAPPPPSMLSVVEDAPPAVNRHVTRADMQFPVEEPPPPAQVVDQANGVSDPVIIPGGSIQTRDYYNDSSSRRRKSLDRSSSIRKTAAAVVGDMEEPKLSVSSAISIDAYSGSMRDNNNYAVETTDNGFFREPVMMVGERKVNSNDNNKKSKRWGKWSILGLIYRKSVNKYEEEEEEEDRYRRLNGGMVERSLSESWPELRNGGGPRMVRSNSNVSWRSSGGGSVKKVNNGLERNKSSRYSPKNGENGMLRFYLPPMKGSRRMSSADGVKGYGKWSRKSLEEAIFTMFSNTQRTYTSADDLLTLDFTAESEYQMFPGEEITIAKGYLSVIHHLASVLPQGVIQLNRKVRKIEWQSNEDVDNRHVKLHFSDGSVVFADHVIVTVSLGVLKAGIESDAELFSPPLPHFKSDAIKRLGFGVVNKLFVEMSHRNFPPLQLVFDREDSEFRFVKIPWWMRRTASITPIHSNSKVLLSWFAGKEALELEKLTDEEIIDGVVTTVSCLTGKEVKKDTAIASRPLTNGSLNDENEVMKVTKVLKSKWGSDPLFRGSYSYVAVGSSGDDIDTMAEPLPKINKKVGQVNGHDQAKVHELQVMFAGEATHRTHYSTTHGAYYSGLREANRLLKHYKCNF